MYLGFGEFIYLLFIIYDGEKPHRLKTLASRGLEEPAHALRGLEEPFFQLCCCVSFWFWREIGLCVYTRSPVVRVFATTGYQPTGQCSPPT